MPTHQLFLYQAHINFIARLTIFWLFILSTRKFPYCIGFGVDILMNFFEWFDVYTVVQKCPHFLFTVVSANTGRFP